MEDASDRATASDRDPVGVGRGRRREPGPTTRATTASCSSTATRRNVVDRYRYWTLEAIVADLDTRRHPFHVAIENWQHDLNIGSIVRTANAFLAETVHIVGRRRWNKRGAMVTDRYQHVLHHDTIDDLVAGRGETDRRSSRSTTCRASVDVDAITTSRSAACCCSARRARVSRTRRSPPRMRVVEIRQFGSTRSINAAAAAAIVMHEWMRQHAPP